MTRLVIAAGMVLLASPVFAQVANQQSNSITPPILEEGTPAQAPIIQLGGPAAAPPKVAAKPAPAAAPAVRAAAPSGQGTIKAYGSWSTQCFDAPVGGIKCQMVQKVEMQGQVLLVMALAADSKASTTNLQIAVPLGVAIGEGVQILIGHDYQNQVQINRCTQQGCIIEGKMTDALLAAMKKGASGSVIVVNESKKQIPLTFQLNGFTDAYAAMVAANG